MTEQGPPDETAGEPAPDTDLEAGDPAGEFWTEGEHDDTGLDLARSLAKSTAGAARMAPR